MRAEQGDPFISGDTFERFSFGAVINCHLICSHLGSCVMKNVIPELTLLREGFIQSVLIYPHVILNRYAVNIYVKNTVGHLE